MKPRTLTPEEADLFATSRLAAEQLRPYYRRGLLALRPVAVDEIGTLGVDSSWRIYVDFKWFGSHTLAERAALIGAHEIEHLLRDHFKRCCGRDPEFWNIAGDAEINDDALDLELPPDKVMPSTLGCPNGLLAEEYYLKVVGNLGSFCGGGSGAGSPQKWELPPDETGVSEMEAETIRNAVAADVLIAAAKNPVPRHIRMWAEARQKPITIDWRRQFVSLLGQTLSTLRGNDDISFRRLHRRQQPGKTLRPRRVQSSIRVGVVVDTSGSMGEFGDAVISVSALLSKYDCKYVQIDAEVQRISRRLPREWKGGGDTDLCPAIEKVLDQNVIVVVTDGLTPWPSVPPPVPVIVVLLGEGTFSPPQWTKIVRVPEME